MGFSLALPFREVTLTRFGGLYTEADARDLPMGSSPLNWDVDYLIGSVGIRPGLTSQFAAIAGNPTVNYVKSYEQANLNNITLALDSTGFLWAELTAGTLTHINTAEGQAIIAGSRGQSSNLFGREYIALGDGKFGIDIPRQYDGTNFDRVSQVGPGAGPTGVLDNTIAITGISRTSGITAVTTAVSHGFALGELINIQGEINDGTFNGFTVVLTIPAANQFTAFGSPGVFALNSLTRQGGTVTAVISGQAPAISPGATIAIVNPLDPSFAGLFTVATISGSTITWAQAGANAATTGGQLYANSGSTVDSVYQITLGFINGGPSGSGYAVIVLNAGQNFSNFTGGNQVTVAGSPFAGYNTTFSIVYAATVGVNQWGVQIAAPGGAPNVAFGGTATAGLPNSSPVAAGVVGAGSAVSQGPHQIVVTFKTRQGAILKPSPPVLWIAAGGFQGSITGIPTGPPNIVARIIGITGSGSQLFYYLPSTTINDNTTTTLTINLSDAAIAAGTPINQPSAPVQLFNLAELGEVSGFIGYSNRLFAWGERNKVSNFQNLTFDGGWNLGGGTGGSDVPLGWTSDATNGAGGSRDQTNFVWGDAYKITGNGNPICGQIRQSVFQDYLNVRILQDQTAYSIRVRAIKGGGIAAGTLNIDVNSPSQGPLGMFTVSLANISTTGFTEFTGPLLTAQNIPADAIIRCYVSGTPTNGGWITVDNIEPFPTAQPYNTTIVRGSNFETPESFDGVNGLLGFSQNVEAVRSAFVLTDRSSLVTTDHLYLVKEHSLYRTTDNGQAPANWNIVEISRKVGTPSVNGVDVAEDWAIIADRTGVYLYQFGSEPVKISQEIQQLWEQIYWPSAATIWVKIDRHQQRVLVGVPMVTPNTWLPNAVANATPSQPNVILTCSYLGIVNADTLAQSPNVHVSAFSGALLSRDITRKWSPWQIASASAAWIERPDGSQQLWFSGESNGLISKLDSTAKTDNGAAINETYYTYGFSDEPTADAKQLGTIRRLYGYVTATMDGIGNMVPTLYPDSPQTSFVDTQAPVKLTSPDTTDVNIPINETGGRIFIKFATDGNAGSFFNLHRVVVGSIEDPKIPVSAL